MKKTLIALMTTAAFASCTTSQKNPLLSEWDTPYGIPPFSEISVDDYIPAIQAGIEQQTKEIDAIVADTAAPTFANTIEPLERSGSILAKVQGVLFNIHETDRTDALDSIVNLALPMLTAHGDNISFNKGLYERVAKVYHADQTALTREQQMVLKKHFESFERSGIGLPDDKQERLRQINADLAVMQQKVSTNILAENNAFKARFGVGISEYPTAMTTTTDRARREAMWKAYTTRCHNGNDNDNRQLIHDIMALRIEKAKIMGYKSPAHYILEPKMAHDPETVDAFLSAIMKQAVVRAKAEIADMQQEMNADIKAGLLPAGSTIQPWDWWYYAEKVRKAKYALNEDSVKQYFKLDNVVKGIFTAAERLYGVKMERLEGVPTYNDSVVTAYKMTDADGSLLGIYTTDFLPRDSKRGGAWMNNVRDQYYDAEGNNVRPIIVNVGNLDRYMTIDQVLTVFHEFGHALHGILSQCHYPSVSGTSVSRDFVEMFSQINENWAFQPDLLAEYAVNDKGEVIPAELVEKINRTAQFNQGFMTTELCAASILDMKWHELESVEDLDIDAFEKKVCDEMGLIPEIAPRYRSTYFSHIFSGGYSAGYYGYLWAEVLDKDAFAKFEASGDVWNKELATAFRKTFLEKGGSEEPMVLFEQFMGRKPDNAAFLRGRGLQ